MGFSGNDGHRGDASNRRRPPEEARAGGRHRRLEPPLRRGGLPTRTAWEAIWLQTQSNSKDIMPPAKNKVTRSTCVLGCFPMF